MGLGREVCGMGTGWKDYGRYGMVILEVEVVEVTLKVYI